MHVPESYPSPTEWTHAGQATGCVFYASQMILGATLGLENQLD